ncbi:hypothetical protein AB0P15_37985 [Streptomyces sp. NPDC087917]|uniref:hypothetical protein n=1 Tax=Streptomyces sp. NPDC087917 TaxID=3155060 RepID=UPI00343462D0
MTTEAILFLVTAVILPMALTELGDWCPRLAKNLVRWTARRLGDSQAIERYSEEWTAELEADTARGLERAWLLVSAKRRWAVRALLLPVFAAAPVEAAAGERAPVWLWLALLADVAALACGLGPGGPGAAPHCWPGCACTTPKPPGTRSAMPRARC